MSVEKGSRKNIIGHKQIEKELRESWNLLERVFESVHVLIAHMDKSFNFLRVNRAYAEADGHSPDFFVGKNHFELYPNLENEAIFHKVVETGQPYFAHARPFIYPNQPERGISYWDWRVEPICDGHGEIQSIILSLLDVTESTLASQALRESEARLRDLVEQAPDGIFVANLEGYYTDVNGAGCRMLGYTRDEIVGKSITDLIPREDVKRLQESKKQLLAGKSHVGEWTLRHRNGSYIPVEVNARILPDGRWQGFVRDISIRKQAEEKLRISEEKFRLITETVNDVFWMSTPGIKKMIYVSPAYEEIWGRSRDSLYQDPRSFIEAVHPDDRESVLGGVPRHARGSWDYEYRIVRPDETIRWIRDRGFPIRDRNGELYLMTGVATDITAQKRSELELRQAATVFNSTMEAIMIADADYKIIRINQAFTDITGFEPDEVLGENFQPAKTGRHNETFYRGIRESLEKNGQWQGEIWKHRKNGDMFPAWENISVIKDEEGRITNYVSVMSDISPMKQAEERLSHLAYHDALTGLPNRLAFAANLEQSLERAKRHKQKIALLYLDLDRFKIINDSMGHAAGDQLLQAVSARLKKCVRAEDTVARLGGDEFTIILDEIVHPEDAAILASKIIEAIDEPFLVEDRQLVTSTSIGISIYPDDALDAEDLAKVADMAMYRAKERGRHTYEFYTGELTTKAMEQMALEDALRQALVNNEFVLYYQPFFGMRRQKIVGVEALLRWQHPERGLISPDEFIEVAEESDLIQQIGDWVLCEACMQAAAWRAEGLPPLRVAINLSGRQVLRNDLATRMRQAMVQCKVRPGDLFLELEVTERMLYSTEHSLECLRQMKSLGLQIAIDDFGIGYSSLSQLKQLPVDTLKIDRSFIKDIPDDPDDNAIAAAIISLAHTMDLNVVAEGVETSAQLDFLEKLGCDEIQGYLFSKPVNRDQIRRLLTAA